MFTHMELIKTELHSAALGSAYELEVYRVFETGEHRVFISRNGDGLDMLTTDGQRTDVVEILIQSAKDEIDRCSENQSC
jgi:hypothetical protein